MSFPSTRMRRNRRTDWSRRLVAENRVSAADLILPIIIIEGDNKRETIPTMPGVERLSIDLATEIAAEAVSLGIPGLALFPAIAPELKSPDGAEALKVDNLVGRALTHIKKQVPGIGLIADVALDPYTSHGHDGLLVDGEIVNDATVEILCRQALAEAEAGVDIVAPSDMMDGRVGAIREALDGAGYQNVQILSYAAKYASIFYGPFRDALSTRGLLKGDKRTYQMDVANTDEALREIELDIEEGADMVMVKPGMPYLDVIHRVKEAFGVPTFAYHVSGEYAMLRFAAEHGAFEYEPALMEALLCFRRAGADAVLTYGALDAARRLKAG
ncbi:MAG TPA: porphobilinogen synthase [Alphaproteobacteria bacterium]|jgi:porphobilinogen synthase|nr:porphobilinogen synthase [Alphaproteobacteria bacterium]